VSSIKFLAHHETAIAAIVHEWKDKTFRNHHPQGALVENSKTLMLSGHQLDLFLGHNSYNLRTSSLMEKCMVYGKSHNFEPNWYRIPPNM
jgi:hypothetical protein